MNCICQRVKDVNVCATSIEIGFIDMVNSSVMVVISNDTLDTEFIFLETTSASGLVIVELDNFNLSVNFDYSIKVTNSSGVAYPIQILPYSIFDCLSFSAKRITANLEDFPDLLTEKLKL